MSMIGPLTEKGCMPWLGNILKHGYGQVKIKQQPYYAHRIAYYIKTGIDPKELLILHECNNPSCVNPEHLILGTNSDNMLQKFREGRASNKGNNHSQHLLNEELVRQIRELSKNGMTIVEIAKRFTFVHVETVGSVVRRTTWDHVQ